MIALLSEMTVEAVLKGTNVITLLDSTPAALQLLGIKNLADYVSARSPVAAQYLGGNNEQIKEKTKAYALGPTQRPTSPTDARLNKKSLTQNSRPIRAQTMPNAVASFADSFAV